MLQDKYLERSHAPYSWKPLAATYLIVLLLTVTVVVGASLLNEPTIEIVNGLPFATDIPGLDLAASKNVYQWKEQFGLGFIGFVRLVPVQDRSELDANPQAEVYSLGREDQDGSVFPVSYCTIFNESDLMSRLEMGTNYYTIYR